MTDTKVCTRCKGKGYGDWVQEHGICYGCRGKGTHEAQLQVRAAAKRRMAILMAPPAVVSVSVEAGTRREAIELLVQAFHCLPTVPEAIGQEVEPGLWAFTFSHSSAISFDEWWTGAVEF